MFRVLEPGGYLLLNVAAMPMLHGSHSVLSGEIRRYTRRGLKNVLEGGGFQIRRVTYTNASTLPITAGIRFAQRLLGHEASAVEISVPPAPVNAALTAVLALESLALNVVDLPAGSSLLCLAQKPIS
jgi:hypothetical protein